MRRTGVLGCIVMADIEMKTNHHLKGFTSVFETEAYPLFSGMVSLFIAFNVHI